MPDDAEWSILWRVTVGKWQVKQNLKSRNKWNGANTYGFSALPAGTRDDGFSNGEFSSLGQFTSFWSSSKYNGEAAIRRYLSSGFDPAYDSGNRSKCEGFLFVASGIRIYLIHLTI